MKGHCFQSYILFNYEDVELSYSLLILYVCEVCKHYVFELWLWDKDTCFRWFPPKVSYSVLIYCKSNEP